MAKKGKKKYYLLSLLTAPGGALGARYIAKKYYSKLPKEQLAKYINRATALGFMAGLLPLAIYGGEKLYDLHHFYERPADFYGPKVKKVGRKKIDYTPDTFNPLSEYIIR